jgi:hypothetical protein
MRETAESTGDAVGRYQHIPIFGASQNCVYHLYRKLRVSWRLVLGKGSHWHFQMFSATVYDTTLDWLAVFQSGASLSRQRRPPVISQTSQQPRIPPLRTVIADGNAQSLLLPDQDEQPLAPRDARVAQVALEQHVVLRGERDHHCRKLRSLRLVDRDRVSDACPTSYAGRSERSSSRSN